MWYYYEPAKPKQVKDGIKAKTKRGSSFGSTWWSKRWISLLESFGWSNRLQRGRSYARKGQVVDIDIEKGEVISHVQGTQRKPYRVKIGMKQISEGDWEKVADSMAQQAIFAAQLLAGEMPQDIEDAFKAAKVNLFSKKGELKTDCSCPDWANPCKHIAAVYYLLGERFDEDPFLIFLLRGRSKEELMEMLRKRRAGDVPTSEEPDGVEETAAEMTEEPPGFAADISFFECKEPVDEFSIELTPPEVEAAVIKRLGKPTFWKSRKQFAKVFEPTYAAATNLIHSEDV